MGSKYDWKPLNDGPGPGAIDLPVPKIKGGYIEPEPERMYSMFDMKMTRSQMKENTIKMQATF